MSNVELTFLGAAQTVTGSKTLVTYASRKILVDSGLFQGPKELRERNWKPFSGADELDCVVITHAHIDHSGYLPRLVKDGFQGPVYCTPATAKLLEIMLRDAAKLQEEDAAYANRSGHSRHRPAQPLYTLEDAVRALKLIRPVPFHKWVELTPEIGCHFSRAGHILGSAIVQLSIRKDQGSQTITFSGDLGNSHQFVIKGPEVVKETDVLVLESTYGDRRRPKQDSLEALRQVILEVEKNRGVLLIPAFSVGRTQEVLFMLGHLEALNRIPKLPVYLDSPMATSATHIYGEFIDELKPVSRDGKIELPLEAARFKVSSTVEESKELMNLDGPAIIVSAAGMVTGGRIIHHLKKRLPDKRNAVLFVGYQAPETKGRLLLDGIPRIRLHHEDVEVKAAIYSLPDLSAHADSSELLDWVRGFSRKPETVILNHGEPQAMKAMAYRLEHELGLKVVLPFMGQTLSI